MVYGDPDVASFGEKRKSNVSLSYEDDEDSTAPVETTVPIEDVMIRKSKLPGDSANATDLDDDGQVIIEALCAKQVGAIKSFAELPRELKRIVRPFLKECLHEVGEGDKAELLKEPDYSDDVDRNKELCQPGVFTRTPDGVRCHDKEADVRGDDYTATASGPACQKWWPSLTIAHRPELGGHWQLRGTTASGRGVASIKNEKHREKVLPVVKAGTAPRPVRGQRPPIRVVSGKETFENSMLKPELKFVKYSDATGAMGAKMVAEDTPLVCDFLMDFCRELAEEFAEANGYEVVERAALRVRPKQSRNGGPQVKDRQAGSGTPVRAGFKGGQGVAATGGASVGGPHKNVTISTQDMNNFGGMHLAGTATSNDQRGTKRPYSESTGSQGAPTRDASPGPKMPRLTDRRDDYPEQRPLGNFEPSNSRNAPGRDRRSLPQDDLFSSSNRNSAYPRVDQGRPPRDDSRRNGDRDRNGGAFRPRDAGFRPQHRQRRDKNDQPNYNPGGVYKPRR